MTVRTALFVGDVGLDTTMRLGHVPGPDEKVLATEVRDDAGGVVANAAAACCLAEVSVRLLCATGDDPAGVAVTEDLRQLGVAVSSGQRRGPTCRALILLEPTGEKRLVLVPGSSMYPTLGQVGQAELDGVGWVHTAVYDVEAAALLASRCRVARVSWSIDLEPATIPEDLDDLRPVLEGAETVFVNRLAASSVKEPIVERLFHYGVRSVVLSLGAEGACLLTDGVDNAPSSHFKFDLRTRPVKDTTGAGDCLAGWFIAERMRGRPPTTALQTAVVAASLSCTRVGAHRSYPNRDEVETVLDTVP